MQYRRTSVRLYSLGIHSNTENTSGTEKQYLSRLPRKAFVCPPVCASIRPRARLARLVLPSHPLALPNYNVVLGVAAAAVVVVVDLDDVVVFVVVVVVVVDRLRRVVFR